MADRTMKFLLSAIALLLLGLLIRPALSIPAAEAQIGFAKPATSSQMIEDNDAVYVLQNGVLTVYQLESTERGPKNPQQMRLRRLAVQTVSAQ